MATDGGDRLMWWRRGRWAFGVLWALVGLYGCNLQNPNSPYRPTESNANTYYTSFSEPPKHLDPAQSYSSDEFRFIAQIYEPPLQYHYLKRPYELVPLTAEEIPAPVYYDADGRVLSGNPPADRVARVVYEIRIKPGIVYQNHPALARTKDGDLRYAHLTDDALAGVDEISDFAEVGTRELKARDYVTQIRRLADPRLNSPIFSILKGYIAGMGEYRAALQAEIQRVRAERRAQGGLGYDPTRDEREHPIQLDYEAFPFEGAQVIDEHTYRIVLTRKYPQFLYWLAMPFFAPVPEEAVAFYEQGPLIKRNITLDRFPIGTGPYRIGVYRPNMEITLVRNENFHDERYPSEGEPGDSENGLLNDAGKKLPFIDEIVYKLEKEGLPRWNKFLQGYYDASGISEDSFDQAIVVNAETGPTLSDFMAKRGIRLSTTVELGTYYLAFNMLDPVVGGYSPEKQKLRQAISIAFDMDEFIQIFLNGRGTPAHSPIPPGIFGAREGRERMNGFVFDWDDVIQGPVPKPVEEAKRLLAEAGYPDGRDADGNPLTISFDNAWTGAGARTRIRWYTKKLAAIGVTLINNTTDYSRFRDKVDNANFQLISWGWYADYPDPENFLFLLYGPNSQSVTGGPNSANYDNPEFNRLFEQMENMTDSPARLAIIDRMTRIAQEDAPWIWGFHPVSFSLRHAWVHNASANTMASNGMKYLRLSPDERARKRAEWNRPNYVPAAGFLVLLVAAFVPAILRARRRDRES